jgi:hypothetical protein
VMIF